MPNVVQGQRTKGKLKGSALRQGCTKAAWTKGQALKVAKFWRQRAYECPDCHKWHCSKQDRTRDK